MASDSDKDSAPETAPVDLPLSPDPGPSEGASADPATDASGEATASHEDIDLDSWAQDEEKGGLGLKPTLELDSVVPCFRQDLVLTRSEAGKVYEVADPKSGKRFSLYEFEISVGRMLDGQRLVSTLIEDGARLGIPVDLVGLRKFIDQLERYGFLLPPGGTPGSSERSPAWGQRTRWDPETRALFQSGIRMMRTGRPGEARSYFEAILDSDPAQPEAMEMMALIDAGTSLRAQPLGARVSERLGEEANAGAVEATAPPPTAAASFDANSTLADTPDALQPSPRQRSPWAAVAMVTVLVAGAVAITYLITHRHQAPAPSGALTAGTKDTPDPNGSAPTPEARTGAAAETAARGALAPGAKGAAGTGGSALDPQAAAPSTGAATTPDSSVTVAGPRVGDVVSIGRPVLATLLAKRAGRVRFSTRAHRRVRKGQKLGQLRGRRRLTLRAPHSGLFEPAVKNRRKQKRGATLAHIVAAKGWWVQGRFSPSVPGLRPLTEIMLSASGGEAPVSQGERREDTPCIRPTSNEGIRDGSPLEGGKIIPVRGLSKDAPCFLLAPNKKKRAKGHIVSVEISADSSKLVVAIPETRANRWVGHTAPRALQLELPPKPSPAK